MGQRLTGSLPTELMIWSSFSAKMIQRNYNMLRRRPLRVSGHPFLLDISENSFPRWAISFCGSEARAAIHVMSRQMPQTARNWANRGKGASVATLQILSSVTICTIWKHVDRPPKAQLSWPESDCSVSPARPTLLSYRTFLHTAYVGKVNWLYQECKI